MLLDKALEWLQDELESWTTTQRTVFYILLFLLWSWGLGLAIAVKMEQNMFYSWMLAPYSMGCVWLLLKAVKGD